MSAAPGVVGLEDLGRTDNTRPMLSMHGLDDEQRQRHLRMIATFDSTLLTALLHGGLFSADRQVVKQALVPARVASVQVRHGRSVIFRECAPRKAGEAVGRRPRYTRLDCVGFQDMYS